MQREKLVIRIFLTLLTMAPVLVFAKAQPIQTGPVKAFRGPEGELITMVEVNESKEMLVHFKNIGVKGDAFEGKTKLYQFTDNGRRGKDVFYNQKRGSKTRQYTILNQTDERWTLAHPLKPTANISLNYSQKDSESTQFEDILKAYQPNNEKETQ
jgi:hypothetical protein